MSLCNRLGWGLGMAGLRVLPVLFLYRQMQEGKGSAPFLVKQFSMAGTPLCHLSAAVASDAGMGESAGEPQLKCSFLKCEWYLIFQVLKIWTVFCSAATSASTVQWTKTKSSRSLNFLIYLKLYRYFAVRACIQFFNGIWKKQVVWDWKWVKCTSWFLVQLISGFA